VTATMSFPGARLQMAVEPSDVEGRFALLEAENDARWESELNRHPRHTKVFYVLAGSYEAVIDGQWRDLRAGEVLVVPAGSVHGFRAGPHGGRTVMLYPPESAGFFAEVAALGGLGALTLGERNELYRRHEVDGLGPLPQRS
jgi:mannose-6-phosphate isomerase-like protein (cupin superfamily)